MSSFMSEALDDLTAHGEETPADLFERFLAWVRPSTTGLPVDRPNLSD
jgi:hypothetical protein